MRQDGLNNKEHDLKTLKRQLESLLECAWQRGYQSGFNDGYETRREADMRGEEE